MEQRVYFVPQMRGIVGFALTMMHINMVALATGISLWVISMCSVGFTKVLLVEELLMAS